jgi:hypothetical protein
LLFKNLLLFSFALFIGPIGILIAISRERSCKFRTI